MGRLVACAVALIASCKADRSPPPEPPPSAVERPAAIDAAPVELASVELRVLGMT